MTDIIGTIFVALIGGAVVYITTGPALGATRSRKAVRELLEIRSALDQGDGTHRAAVDRVLAKEVSVLEAMGDTRQRLLLTVLNIGATLFAIAGITGAAQIFILSEPLREIVRYVCGASFLLVTAVPLLILTDARNRQSSWQGKLKVTLIFCATSALSLTFAVVSVYGTTYMDQLIESFKPA